MAKQQLLVFTFSKFVTRVKMHRAYHCYEANIRGFNSLLSHVSLQELLFSRSPLSLSYRSMKETQCNKSHASWLHRTI